MADPLTATAIATLAFLDYLMKTEAGKTVVSGIWTALGEKMFSFSAERVAALMAKGKATIEALREAIRGKLAGNDEAEAALKAVEDADFESFSTISYHLKRVMAEDQTFADQVQQMAQQIINIGKIEGENVQNVFGGQAQQITGEKATANQFGPNATVYINTKPD